VAKEILRILLLL